MSPFWRRSAIPDDVAAMAGEHGKVLAWGRTHAGLPVLATETALLVRQDGTVLDLPWHRIDRAFWEPPSFTVRYRDPGTGAPRSLQLPLAEHGELPPVVRQRVTLSVVTSRRVELASGAGAVLAARRDGAGAVTWTVVFDAGVDPTDAELQGEARQALAAFRRSLGV